MRHKQFYWPDTNVLVTRFLHPDGIGEVEDYMPVGGAGGAAADQLVRRVRVVRGRMPFRLECRPAFDYARGQHETHLSEHGARFDGPGLSLGLASTLPLARDGAGVTADFTLGEGESATFVLRLARPRTAPPATARGPARRRTASGRRSPTGGAGSPAAPTAGGGGRWSSARPWRSSC